MALPVGPVAAGAALEYERESGHLLDTKTAAGWATILGIGGIVGLAVLLYQGNMIEAFVKAFEFLLLITLAELGIHYLARVGHLSNPGSPFWAGLGFDL